AVIVRDGIRRMFGEHPEDIFYYITIYNDNYPMAAIPQGCEEGILKGMYKFKPAATTPKSGQGKAHLFGSGPILPYAVRAQAILAEQFGVAADVWSVTSYQRLRRDAMEAERWNFLHPAEKPRQCHIETVLAKEGKDDVYVASSDYMKIMPEGISKWV